MTDTLALVIAFSLLGFILLLDVWHGIADWRMSRPKRYTVHKRGVKRKRTRWL